MLYKFEKLERKNCQRFLMKYLYVYQVWGIIMCFYDYMGVFMVILVYYGYLCYYVGKYFIIDFKKRIFFVIL